MLERYDLVRRKLDVIADPVSAYAVSGDGTRLVVRDRETLRVLRVGPAGSSAPETGRRRRVRDRHAPDRRHGRPGRRVAADVRRGRPADARPLLGRRTWPASTGRRSWRGTGRWSTRSAATTTSSTCCGRCSGELGTSHAYVIGGACAAATGRGGPGCSAPTSSAPSDGWRVARVLPPESSAPDARSPLAGPGVDVRAGDVILDVDGRPVDPELGARAAAGRHREPAGRADRAHRPDRAGAGEVRRVVVRPLLVGVGAALPGLGGGPAGVRRRPFRRAGSATCTSPTWCASGLGAAAPRPEPGDGARRA